MYPEMTNFTTNHLVSKMIGFLKLILKITNLTMVGLIELIKIIVIGIKILDKILIIKMKMNQLDNLEVIRTIAELALGKKEIKIMIVFIKNIMVRLIYFNHCY